MLAFEKFTFFTKFLPTEAIDYQFYYYDYSKIVLPQLLTKWIYHVFLCLVFLLDLLTYLSLLKEFSKNDSFSNSYNLPSQSAVQKLAMSTTYSINIYHLWENNLKYNFKSGY